VLRESLKIKTLKNFTRKKSKIQTPLVLQPQSLFKKKFIKIVTIMEKKHTGADDGTMMRSGDVWKSVNQSINSNNQ
jgi:hypothetical protein